MPTLVDQRDACLFAQYHSSGRIPAHTRHTLTSLAACNLRLHVACAGINQPDPDDARFLHAIGATCHPRVNAGLDFGAWCHLLRAGCANDAPRVIFANDSVFGPFADLGQILAAMNAKSLDAWGMVASHERVWHLQSWFVSLTQRALHSPAVARVFAQDFAPMGKEEVILHGELALGVALRAERLSVGAVWPDPSRVRRMVPVNPSHFDWAAMLTTGAVPFIKAELLRDNPANIAWLGAWRDILGPHAETVAHALPGPPPIRPALFARRVLNMLLTRDHALALRHLWANTAPRQT